MLANFLF